MGLRRVVAVAVFLSMLTVAIGATLLAAGHARAAISGDILWARRVATPFARDDSPIDLAVGPDGSAYVLSIVGRGDDPLYDTMICLTTYSPGGNTRWQRTFTTRGALTDVPVAMAVDEEGNAFIAGVTVTAGEVQEGLLLKYTAAGRRSWIRRWAGATTGSDRFTDVACDGAGNVVVCGHENRGASVSGLFVRKYGPGGATKWSRRYGSSVGSNEGADALAVDERTGAVYIGGSLRRLILPSGTDEDVVVVKYSAAGDRAWVREWESAGDWDDGVDDLVLGPTGEVYVGATVRDVSWGHLAVVNFGSGGRLHWSDSDADKTPLPSPLQIEGMAVDGNDRVRVLLDSPPEAPPVEVRLYAADGTLTWQRQLPLVVADHAAGRDMVVTNAGRAYVTGFVDWRDERNQELFVTAFRADGTGSRWTAYRPGPRGSGAGGSDIVLRDARLYVAGWCDGGTTGDDVRTLRLVP